MSNPILTGINSILSGQEAQNNKGLQSFDLNDNTFSNILDNKLDKTDESKENVQNIVDKLGVPAGLNIEGFDYNSMVSDLDAIENVEPVNTDMNIRDDNKFNVSSLIEDAVDAFSPVVNSIKNSEFNLNPESISNPLSAVKNFWSNQASNFYNIMNKETVNDITDLISKL